MIDAAEVRDAVVSTDVVELRDAVVSTDSGIADSRPSSDGGALRDVKTVDFGADLAATPAPDAVVATDVGVPILDMAPLDMAPRRFDAGPVIEPASTAEVQAMLDLRCPICHHDRRDGDVSLRDITTLIGAPSSVAGIAQIEPGDAERSYLYLKINGNFAQVGGRGVLMPKDLKPFFIVEYQFVGRWINALPR